MEIREHSIGYNTITSTNGIISTRGVRSKPNDLQVFGYTHEIGEGEKSPDNPYTLVSLDSGNMNLCNNWNYTSNLFTIIGNRITVQKASNTIQYAMSSFKEFTYDKTKLYIYLKYRGSFTAGAKIPVCSIKLYTVEKKQLYYRMISDRYPKDVFNKCIEIDLSSIDINSIAYYSLIIEGLTYDGSADYDFTIDVLMCENYISSYFEDEHSIVLYNNDKNIQVPTQIALHSVAGKSDILTKNGGVWGIKVRTSVFNSNDYINTLKYTGESPTGTHVYRMGDIGTMSEEEQSLNIVVCISNFLNIVSKSTSKDNIAKLFHLDNKNSLYIRYQHNLYSQFSSVETLKEFLLENPIEIIFPADKETFIPLSEYAQDLLNSFTLQNENNIYVERYPDLKISGYLQKI